jgi:acyl carrier protein
MNDGLAAAAAIAGDAAQLQRAIESWLVAYIADLLDIPHARVDPTKEFSKFGLDSSAAIGMTGDLAAWLGIELSPTVAYDWPTIRELAGHLSAMASTGGRA